MPPKPLPLLQAQVVPHAFVGTKEMVALHGKQTVRRAGHALILCVQGVH